MASRSWVLNLGSSTFFHRPLTVPLHHPNCRQMPAHVDCERVYWPTRCLRSEMCLHHDGRAVLPMMSQHVQTAHLQRRTHSEVTVTFTQCPTQAQQTGNLRRVQRHLTGIRVLTHWGRDKMTTFSWIKTHEFLLRFHWSLFLRVQLTIFEHWFRQWLGAGQATSHYLNQWWLDYQHIYALLGLNELNKSLIP